MPTLKEEELRTGHVLPPLIFKLLAIEGLFPDAGTGKLRAVLPALTMLIVFGLSVLVVFAGVEANAKESEVAVISPKRLSVPRRIDSDSVRQTVRLTLAALIAVSTFAQAVAEVRISAVQD